MISSQPALSQPFFSWSAHCKKPFCRLSPNRQLLCCSPLDDGSRVVKECWLLTDHLSLTTTCRLLSPPARAAMMDRASIAQPSSPSPPAPPHTHTYAQTDTHSSSCRAFVSQASGGSSRLDTAEKDRQVNTAAILFSAYPLSSCGGHLQFTSRVRERIAWWMHVSFSFLVHIFC